MALPDSRDVCRIRQARGPEAPLSSVSPWHPPCNSSATGRAVQYGSAAAFKEDGSCSNEWRSAWRWR